MLVPEACDVTGIFAAGLDAAAAAPSDPSLPPPHAVRARIPTTTAPAHADRIGLMGTEV
jgi:hypothetical protein